MSNDLIPKDSVLHISKDDDLEIGQWYWYDPGDCPEDCAYCEDGEEHPSYLDKNPWLGCVVKIGSNFVQIEGVFRSIVRVHFDEFFNYLTREKDPQTYLNRQIGQCKAEVSKLMNEVMTLTARLGVSPRIGLPATPEGSSTALMVLNKTPDVSSYKSALIKAKDEELPDLFKLIRETNENLATWMKAETIPLKALTDQMKGSISEIEDRIFNVSLYAGLTEEVEKVRDGASASFDEKLRLMQRRLYMDEECLLHYEIGGMEFQDIREFDKWISRDEHFHRLLPFPRCMVAMQVRRTEKDRHNDGTLATAFINFELAKKDEYTYFYIRNGEQLYRMGCVLEFGEKIFPDHGKFDPTEPMMAKLFCGRVDELITLRDYEERCAERERKRKAEKKWKRDNPFKKWAAEEGPRKDRWGGTDHPRDKWDWKHANPHNGWERDFQPSDWGSFDQDNVYFDEILQEITDQVKYYNRISLIIQGLYDRSEILHPHPPVKTWTDDGFDRTIELIYDSDGALYATAEPLDFEEYRARCNASLNKDSVVIGQELFWKKKEAEKENARMDRNWRETDPHYHDTFKPYGNPGPGRVAKMAQWQSRAKKAVFRWWRKRQNYNPYGRNGPIKTSITVPASQLFNISAYQPGDFRQFFEDPRTRAAYFQWAPILLIAEEYHAANIEVREPLEPIDDY